jgi:hypothetical protein
MVKEDPSTRIVQGSGEDQLGCASLEFIAARGGAAVGLTRVKVDEA